MTKRALIYNDSANSSPSPTHPTRKLARLGRALELGGFNVVTDRPTHMAGSDIVATWGIRRRAQARPFGAHHLVMELGFLGDRHEHSFLGWGDLNARASFPTMSKRGEPWYPTCLPTPRAYPIDRPVRALFLGQVPTDASLFDFGESSTDMRYTQWIANMRKRAQLLGWDIAWRPHPMGGVDVIGDKIFGCASPRDLEGSLEWCDVAIAYSSNSLLQAVMMGKHVIVGSSTSFAAPLSSTFKEAREWYRSDLHRVLDRAASAQWSTEEIESGLPIPILCEHVCK
jgi:hypothetical protein